MRQTVVALTLFASRAAGHGWVTSPLSKNQMAVNVRNNAPSGFPSEFMYDPQSCARATVCGGSSAASSRGLDMWQEWYDQTNTPVPVLTPGTDLEVRVKLSAEHGGQAWMQIACGVDYENANWTLLERAQSDRSVGFLPSNPAIYSWKTGGDSNARYWHVPSSFQCPTGQAVGRWVWKTGNTCNDFNNLGRVKTESFLESESDANDGTHAAACTGGGGFPETFLTCIDFVMNQTPTPAPPTSQPTPAPPTPPTTAPPPTPQPTAAPAPSQCCTGSGTGGEGCFSPCSSTGWCGASESNCGQCGGNWCGGSSPTPPAPTPVVNPSPTPPAPTTPPAPVPTPPAPGPAQCCYDGCTGNCAEGGWCGSSEVNCGQCGGNWCGASTPAPTPPQPPTPTPTQAPPTPAPAPTPAPPTTPAPPPTPAPDNGPLLEAVLQVLRNSNHEFGTLMNRPSRIYRWSDMTTAVEAMASRGVGSAKLWVGEGDNHVYGLVNIAAFLAQCMKETIIYDACDENNWSDGRTVAEAGGTVYSSASACGQLKQSYQNYECTAEENEIAGGQMACGVDPNMVMRASTQAEWYGAPAKMFCAPKSKVPKAPKWNYGGWCPAGGEKFDGPNVDLDAYFEYVNSAGTCQDYEGIKAGGWEFCNGQGCANPAAPLFGQPVGRTDLEGCCWWGRGVIQTTGVCNFGKLNYYLGKRAASEGRDALFPQIDFCTNPNAICEDGSPAELKWIAGFFYWLNAVQTYSTVAGEYGDASPYNYLDELKAWVDGGMNNGDARFINGASGIVNRGCHNPPNCGTGVLDGEKDRQANFNEMLTVMGVM